MSAQPICTACGTEYSPAFNQQENCPICSNDRQYIPENGQAWTSIEELVQTYSILSKNLTEGLCELKMAPSFAIGQRALLVCAPSGNILWDCISLINETTFEFIKSKGGLRAIAISHPHYYTTMNRWADAFNCPIYIHSSDKDWVCNKSLRLKFWNGNDTELWDGIKLINIGGHFPGSSILQVPFLSAGGGILCGDTFYISPSKNHMAVMYSYPNKIPLTLKEINRIKQRMASIEFDSMFGFYDYQNIYSGAKAILLNSLDRYY